MRLGELIKENEYISINGERGLSAEVGNVAYDSRRVGPGGCFICIKGYESDGHDYIPQAYENGAGVFVVEQEEIFRQATTEYPNATFLHVEDSRRTLSAMADRFYGSPSKKMTVVGVTGTNGKTSVTTYIYNALTEFGIPAGLIGTIDTRICGEIHKSERTTPESLELQKIFRKMADRGVKHVVMEVSSHALKLCRVENVDFDIAVFTNLTQDHLDFHKTMEEYSQAKYGLMARAKKIAILNGDDEYGRRYAEALKKEGVDVSTFSILGQGDVSFHSGNKEGVSSISCLNEGCEIELEVMGRFEAYNKMAAIAVLEVLGFNKSELQKAAEGLKGAAGRFQKIEGTAESRIDVIVDYAHTPDALLNVIEAVNDFRNGDLFTVFGCGGERDRSKRPIMGGIASEGSAHVIITDDNPRRENPDEIVKEIVMGIKKGNFTVVRDRRSAIFKAIGMARPGDVVLIAGKGHEKKQIIGEKSFSHDDCEVAREALEGLHGKH